VAVPAYRIALNRSQSVADDAAPKTFYCADLAIRGFWYKMTRNSVKARGRPKVMLIFRPGDQERIQAITACQGLPHKQKERLNRILACLSLAASGKHSHEEIATLITLRGCMLSVGDFTNLAALAGKLKRRTDILSAHLWSKLSPSTQAILASYSGVGPVPQALPAALIQDLNSLIQDGPIWDLPRFASVQSLTDIMLELRGKPQGLKLARLNRMALDECYSSEIKARDPKRVFKSQVTSWLGLYRSPEGLDAVLITPHMKPRKELRDLDKLLWLVAGLVCGKVRVGKDAVEWLHRRKVTISEAMGQRYLNSWRRAGSDSSGEPQDHLKAFLQILGAVPVFADAHHKALVDALRQLSGFVRFIQSNEQNKTPLT